MAASKKKKIFGLVLIIFFGIIIGISISFYLALKLSVPITEGTKKIDGIEQPVEIVYDAMGIPQIYAKSKTDAYFALGYVQASERMFQMDLSRRLAKGRLSEMFGSISFEVDLDQRRIGHYRLGEAYLKRLSDDNRKLLEAFAAGINSYRNHCRALPFEYRFLPVTFEEWTVLDCLTLLSFQTYYSNGLMNRDRFLVEAIKKVGYEKAKSLLLPYPPWAATTVKNDKLSSIDRPEILLVDGYSSKKIINEFPDESTLFQRKIFDAYFAEERTPLKMSEASNAWVIAPKRSHSGAAMLASDPHLEIGRLPQFWYAVGIHCDEDSLDVFGITTPGLPFVVMGRNKSSAYAFTAAGTDLVDYFFVPLVDSNKFIIDGKEFPFELIKDSVMVEGNMEATYVTHRYSQLGIVEEIDEENNVALLKRWVGFEADLDEAVANGFALSEVDNFESFQKTVTSFGALDVNYLYADVAGHIGYQLSAPLPVRSTEATNFPDSLNYESWTEYYPTEASPQTFDPKEGYLASCNNKPIHDKRLRGTYFANRIVSIEALLNSQDKFAKADMEKFQYDIVDRYLLSFKDHLLDVLQRNEQSYWIEEINNWAGNTDTLSKPTALVNVYFDILKEKTFNDELDDLAKQIPSKWIEHFEQINEANWFDDITTDDVNENFDDICDRSMIAAIEVVGERNWGEMHTLQMKHPLAVIPLIGSLLDLATEPKAHNGTPGSLNASFYAGDYKEGYKSIVGASMRFVIDFAEPDKTSIVLPSGNSGNPMSEHFMDFYPLWESNQRWIVPLDRSKLEVSSVLLLEPR